MDIFVMNSDGSNLIQITDTPGFDNQNPSWQPVTLTCDHGTLEGDVTTTICTDENN